MVWQRKGRVQKKGDSHWIFGVSNVAHEIIQLQADVCDIVVLEWMFNWFKDIFS